MIKFREATADDANAIAQLHAQSWQKVYRGILADDYLNSDIEQERLNVWQERFSSPLPNQHVIVAVNNNEVIAFICVFGKKNDEFGSVIDNLHVSTTHTGMGLGKQLIAQAMNWLIKQYPDVGVYLEVLAGNVNAIGFYDAIGGKKAKESVWTAPCNSDVDEFIYVWRTPSHMLACVVH